MIGIKALAFRYTDDSNPGWVECRFTDAWGHEWTILEKVPVVTTDDLSADTQYPHPVFLGCEVIKEWLDDSERSLVTVDTEKPWGIETIDNQSRFDVLHHQIIRS